MPLKILFLTHRIPHPLTDGGAIVSNFMLDGFLNNNVELSLISLNTTKHFVDIEKLPALYDKLKLFKTVIIDNRIKLLPAIFNLIGNKSYHTSRFASSELNTTIKNVLQKESFDFVILDNIFLENTLTTIRKYSTAKIACRIHNIEHQIWEKLAMNTTQIFKKKYLQIQAKRLKKIELLTLSNVDLLLLLNKNEGLELNKLGVTTPQYVMPFGVDVDSEMPVINILPNACFHFASMDWMPNVEALDWFLDKIFPKVIQQNPNYILHIAGKNMPAKYFNLNNNNIKIYENVTNAKEFIQHHGICIVPLLSGAGIRVKILEALSAGVPVISTSLGADGLNLQNNKNIIISDTVDGFVNAILLNEEHLNTIAKQGLETANTVYNKKIIIQNTINFLQQFLNA